MVIEVTRLKELLVETLHSVHQNRDAQKLLVHHMKTYQQKMQSEADSKSALYRMYSEKSNEWEQEKDKLKTYVSIGRAHVFLYPRLVI